MEQDQQFLEYVVKALVDNPGDVEIKRTVDEMGVLLTLKTDPADMGYVIGRKGQTAQAIRTLLKIVGAKNNARLKFGVMWANHDWTDIHPVKRNVQPVLQFPGKIAPETWERMTTFLIRRLLATVPLLLGILFASFLFLSSYHCGKKNKCY